MGLALMEETMNAAGPFASISAVVVHLCAHMTHQSPCRHLRRFFSAEQSRALQEGYLVYRAAYDQLAQDALANQRVRYHLRPKGHMLEHLSYDFASKNARFFSNFLSEDQVRRVKLVSVRSHPAFMSKHAMYKYLLQTCLPYR